MFQMANVDYLEKNYTEGKNVENITPKIKYTENKNTENKNVQNKNADSEFPSVMHGRSENRCAVGHRKNIH